MQALKVSHKLWLLVVLVVLAIGALIGVGVHHVNQLKVGGPLYRQIQELVRLRRVLAELRVNIGDRRTLAATLPCAAGGDEFTALHQDISELREEISRQFELALTSATGNAVKGTLLSARLTWEQFALANDGMLESVLTNGHPDLREFLRMQGLRQERFTEQLDSAQMRLRLDADELENRAEATVARRTLVVIVTGLALSLVLVISTAVIGQSINRPLQEVTEACSRITEGDLSRRVPVTRRDELGTLAAALNTMTEALASDIVKRRRAEEAAIQALQEAQEANRTKAEFLATMSHEIRT